VPAEQTGKRIAVVGSGPAGMACAQQLARAGHAVTLFEKNDRIGGLLRYGIPDFKMEKHHIDRRMDQMRAEGVTFRPGIEVGVTVSVESLMEEFDAVVMSGGAEQARPLDLPAHNYTGIHFAMDFLPQQNRRNAGDPEDVAAPDGAISAKGKHVVVIGGGDTGSDCVGTSNRQCAASVTQLEIMPRAPDREDKLNVWPDYPSPAQLFRTSTSQAEAGVSRDFAIATKYAIGEDGRITALKCARVEWTAGYDGRMQMQEIEGSEFELKADLVLLAMGFTGPRREGLVEESGVELDGRGNVKATMADYKTSRPKVFACGDMRRGQSLVVWAIREGRQCARSVDQFLMGASNLPR
jgi:glutamate synthase (NADPH/NADH) small chain